VSRSAVCACPTVIVDAARVSPLFFSHILSKSILFLFLTLFFLLALASSFFFFPVLPHLAACASVAAPCSSAYHCISFT
jgi:hypothetical protein